nr:MAG TPA: hypothetical protein [Caudoviricetes sp.]
MLETVYSDRIRIIRKTDTLQLASRSSLLYSRMLYQP